jgi:hypothetical protein
MKVGFVALTAAAFCLPASAQQFWNGTKAGMTTTQLKMLFGTAVKQTEGNPDQYTMTHRFCDTTFEIVFVFDDGKLRNELLHADRRVLPGTETRGQLGRCVVQEYTASYGKPVTIRDRDIAVSYTFTKLDTVVDIDTFASTDLVMVAYHLRNKEL